MSVKIIIDEKKIQAKIDNQWSSGLEMLSSQILRDCNRYCKEDTGMLIMSSFIHSDLKRMPWKIVDQLKRDVMDARKLILLPFSIRHE